jgi:small subunit ribosomal protein S13
MARIAGVDIPRDKQVRSRCRTSTAWGVPRAKILDADEHRADTMVRDLTDDEVARLRAVVEGEMMVEGDLRRVVRGNIQRLVEINCYRGSGTAAACRCAGSGRRRTRVPVGVRSGRWPARRRPPSK